MRRFAMLSVPAAKHLRAALACSFALGVGLLGCGSHGGAVGFGSGGANGNSSGGGTGFGNGGSSGGGAGGGGPFGSFGGDGGKGGPSGTTGNGATTSPDGGMIPCPPGLMCNVSCPTGSTTISGKVYDPAGKNPLYNIPVYIPATPLQPLGKGVPMGADACSCGALFKSGSLAATTTAVDGTFTLTDVPVGDISLVIQVGKWRRSIKLTTKMCQAHPQPDKSLTLPGTMVGAGPDDNMPEIAVSTGGADTLECLMTRIGVPAAEYVAGAATTGHVHLFSGGDTAGGRGGGAGTPEANPMPGAPASSTDLWMTQAQLMPYDITLLSCEGGETYNANPAALEAYLNAGGRAFGSHFHYSFFSGPLGTMQAYTAPTDWGPNLANWTADMGNDGNGPIGGMIDTTLNGSGGPFAKGLALKQWLGLVNALGTDMVPPADLAIYQPRYNSVVVPANVPSQPWITSDPAAGGRRGGAGMPGQTMYFSFDTPVGKGPNYCGRAVFSDLHVAGNPLINDTGNSGGRNGGGMPPPAGCDAMSDLSPQEKALEFMLFDLSACVIPDTVTPPMRPF